MKMQSKYSMFNYGPDDVAAIRKDHNLDTEEKREDAYRIIEEWLLKQDHHVKKKYSKGYLEKCLITCKGSIERTKRQIDFICTMRTLMPIYFQISNLNKSDLLETSRKCDVGYCPNFTKDRCRVLIMRLKPNTAVTTTDLLHMRQFFTIAGDFLKSNDYFQGFHLICDTSAGNLADILMKINFIDLQQFVPVCTEGYGCRLKGIYFVTPSKLIEGFVKMIKSLFKEKIRNRIHVISDKERLKDFIVPNQILPVDYGGSEKKLEEMHEQFWDTLNLEPVQELLKEMNAACTDESKRRQDEFNEHYMGMSGSFRRISLD